MMYKHRIYVAFELLTRGFNKLRGLKEDKCILPGEQFYAQVYNNYLEKYVSNIIRSHSSKNILDVGCGTGRFTIDLATNGHNVTGIDYHKDSIEFAKQKSSEKGVSVEFLCGDAKDLIESLPKNHFDLVLCLEMLLVSPYYKEIMQMMKEVISPGGYLVCSHRTKKYWILLLLSQGHYKAAIKVANSSEGLIPKKDIPIYYNWQTIAELKLLYNKLEFELLGLHPIGMFSGIGIDALSKIANPETMSESNRQTLLELETTYLEDYVGAGRYTLAIARKSTIK